MTCQYNADGICVNADCPYRADYCPCYYEDDICKYKDDTVNHQTVQIEHLSAENKRLQNLLNDLMKDEGST